MKKKIVFFILLLKLLLYVLCDGFLYIVQFYLRTKFIIP